MVCQCQSPRREATGKGEASVAAGTTGSKGPWREAEVQHGVSVSVCEHGCRYPRAREIDLDPSGGRVTGDCESQPGTGSGTQVLSEAVHALYG